MNITTIKENRVFRRMYSKGKFFVSPALVTYVMKNREGCVRVGITASKKTGKAVQRNRSRRIIMAAYRQLCPNIKEGYDIVFVARAKTPYLKSTDILRYMKKQLKQAEVFK